MQWWQVARSQAGAISFRQLVLTGESEATVARLVERGELERFCRGVYLVGAAPITTSTRLWACVLATDGLVSHLSAGRLWGVSDDELDQRIHLTLPHSRRVTCPPGAVLHRVPVPPRARCVRSGWPATSRPWTVMDLVASLPSSKAQRLADRAVQRDWLRPSDVELRLRDQPGRTGNRQLRIIGSQLGDGAAAESERVLHRLLRRAGVTGWVANHPVWRDGELVAVVDVALPGLQVAIEVDGMAHHVDVDRFQRDRHRQNDLVGLGWTVLRFTWWDLTERPGYVVSVLRRFGRVVHA